MEKSLEIIKAELERDGAALQDISRAAHAAGYGLRRAGMSTPGDESWLPVKERVEYLSSRLDDLRAKHPEEEFLSSSTGRIEVSRLLKDGYEEIQVNFSLVAAFKDS